MKRQTMVYIAVLISMLYGIGFAVIHGNHHTWATIGAFVVAAAWVTVGMVGRGEAQGRDRNRNRDALR